MLETAKTFVTPLNQSMDNTGSLNQPKNFLKAQRQNIATVKWDFY